MIADCDLDKVGDGYCNDETNIPGCNYDGGDCCGSCINTNFCENCSCIGDINTNEVQNPSIGDGFCNDELNNIFCHYDGFDCCQSPVDTTLCTFCSCHGKLTVLKITVIQDENCTLRIFY